jgi:hypothetical protein
MKTRSWLVLSVAGNAALLMAVVWLVLRPATPEPVSQPATAAGAAPKMKPAFAARDATPQLAWSDSMAQLRQAGVPSAIIAKVVVEKVAQKWTPLEAQFERQYLNDEIDARRLAEFHDQRTQEEERELRAALGDGYREWHKEYIVQNMYLGGLEPAEAQKEPLYIFETDWRKRLHELEVAKRNGQLDQAAFDAAFAEGENDYKGKVAGIIGHDRVYGEPVENDSATQLRREFSRLQLTDEQINELAAVQKKWSGLRGAMTESLERSKTMDVAYEGDLQAMDRARDEEYRRILGTEVFDGWQKTRDDRYRALRRHAPALGLEPPQVEHVYATLRAYDLAAATFEHQAQARSHAGQAVDWAAVDEGLTAHVDQKEAALRAYLGNERFERMEQQQFFGRRRPPPARHDPNARASAN